MEIKIKKLRETAIIPTRGSQFSAGYDLYADLEKEVVIPAGETVMIPTGLSLELPDGYAAFIFARSGISVKKGLAPANCVGVCDSDYRGEYMVPLFNHTATDATLQPGERMAQMIVLPFMAVSFLEVDELSDTQRAAGGFGSTGI